MPVIIARENFTRPKRIFIASHGPVGTVGQNVWKFALAALTAAPGASAIVRAGTVTSTEKTLSTSNVTVKSGMAGSEMQDYEAATAVGIEINPRAMVVRRTS
jgi:hypothetical protein